METWKTHERAYCRYHDRFVKRTLLPSEYQQDYTGQIYIPTDARKRLENEAASLAFVRSMTDIPVPRVLEAREYCDGTFRLVTELVDGIPMEELSVFDQERVMPEVEVHMKTLHNLRSSCIGGPSGIVCLPPIFKRPNLDVRDVISRLEKEEKEGEKSVFCHNDLSQSNVIVDPKTMRITAIIDWEYAGFFPERFDFPFYRSPRPSGAQ